MLRIIFVAIVAITIQSDEKTVDDVIAGESLQQMADAVRSGDVEKFTHAILDLGDPDTPIGNSISQRELKSMGGGMPMSTTVPTLTPLMALIQGKNLVKSPQIRFQFVELLLALGADPNKQDGAGYCYLNTAVSSNEPELVRLLLLNGARPQDSGKLSQRTLGVAVFACPSLIPDLVAYGCDVNARDPESGISYGHFACHNLLFESLKTLAANGFDVRAKSNRGHNLISSLIVYAREDDVEKREAQKMRRWLERRLARLKSKTLRQNKTSGLTE